MNTMASSSFMSLDLDIQAVFRRTSADILMFVTAALAYWALHFVKAQSATVKTCKASTIGDDQEYPSEHTKGIVEVQTLPQVKTVDSGTPKLNTVQCQPSCLSAQQGEINDTKLPQVKAVQVQPKHAEPCQAPPNVNQLLSSMRNYAAARNIKDTLKTFQLIQRRGELLTSAMYNTVLQAWVNCGNIWAAENFMEEIREAGMSDGTSFAVLIKALVMVDLDKARTLLHEMQETVPSPSSSTFDELLFCLARGSGGGLFNDGISLLKHMHEAGVEPSHVTFCAISKLVNGGRAIRLKCSEVQQVLSKYNFESKCTNEASLNYPSELPRLAAVISQAEKSTSTLCVHDVEIKGSRAEIKALSGTLKQHGFLETLDGQHDKQQDEAHRARIAAVLKCVNKQGLGMPSHLEGAMLEYLGSDPHVVRLNFESNSIRAPVLDEMSCRHPRVGFRHCWAKPTFGSCGQRTFSNGEEIDEASFNRHINAVFN